MMLINKFKLKFAVIALHSLFASRENHSNFPLFHFHGASINSPVTIPLLMMSNYSYLSTRRKLKQGDASDPTETESEGAELVAEKLTEKDDASEDESVDVEEEEIFELWESNEDYEN